VPTVKLGAMLLAPDVGNDPAVIRDHVQALDDAGMDFLTMPEHVIGGHPDRAKGEVVHTYDKPYHEPFVLFGFIAAVTQRMDLVTSILILPQRQTVLVAKQAAELDLLSGGRLQLGVGVGRNWMEYEALNESFTNRGARVEEQVTVLRRLWSEELVTFDGQWHHLDRMGLNPMPVQRPIPIWMGTFVGKVVEKVIRRIGAMADGWLAQMQPNDDFSAVRDRLLGYARDAGRDPSTIGIEGVSRIKPGDDPADWVANALAWRERGATRLKVSTSGFASPTDHRAAALAWLTAVRPALG
jgi:probable F420-dependent oxidoreductase